MTSEPSKGIMSKIKNFLPHSKKKQKFASIDIKKLILTEINKTRDSSLDNHEHIILKNALLLGETRIDDIMIPRPQIEAIEINSTLYETLKVFENSGYSRLPVYIETLDNPAGMIHIHDILGYLTRKILEIDNTILSTPISELNILREILFVPGSMLANKLMQKMQTTRTQMALVIDEYGGTDGLVSLEDVVEILVGDIEDEHDDEPALVINLANGGWIVDAKADIDILKEILGSNFPTEQNYEEIDTVGGLIVTKLGYIPSRGETFDIAKGYKCRVVEADHRRVKKIRIKQINDKDS